MNVNVTGPKILFEIPFLGGIVITESVVCQWIFMVVIIALSLWLVKDLKVKNISRKQALVEKIYGMLCNMVEGSMGKRGEKYRPYIGTLFVFSFMGSISGVLGFRPYTATIAVTGAMALATFVMIQAATIKDSGVKGWIKSYTEPFAFMLPLNIISNAATPVSMAARHFGNITAGYVITSLVYGALGSASAFLLQWIPSSIFNSFPFLQAGVPAVLSLYFDWFGAFIQAFIFCMLTMVFVANACSAEEA
ncbi:MAG: F0F1 ATP synthase subunit A [Clostridia bacterium]|nr:F0F1 ATP synthase subunit A [Clostridia bacterium]